MNLHRRGRVLLAVAALVVGIGSCQLPQPRLPKLLVGAARSSPTAADHRVPVRAGDGPGWTGALERSEPNLRRSAS